MQALQTLELTGLPDQIEGPTVHLGNLPSIRHLNATWWQPPSDATWLVGLKELILFPENRPNIESLQVISACVNLERLTIFNGDGIVAEVLQGAIPHITLPRLQNMHLEFRSNESAVNFIRRLITPQCLSRTLIIEEAPRLRAQVGDYRRFMSPEENCTWQYPESASILIKAAYMGPDLEYATDSRELRLKISSVQQGPTLHELVQDLQSTLKEPALTVTIDDFSEYTSTYLKSLGNQNIQTIVAHFEDTSSEVGDLLELIKTHPTDLPSPDGPTASTTTDGQFKLLRSIYIHNTWVKLVDFTAQVEEHLHKDFKPLLEEIVFVDCGIGGSEITLNQAAERLATIGITLECLLATGTSERTIDITYHTHLELVNFTRLVEEHVSKNSTEEVVFIDRDVKGCNWIKVLRASWQLGSPFELLGTATTRGHDSERSRTQRIFSDENLSAVAEQDYSIKMPSDLTKP
ncbi:hypothetical protein FRC00_002648 [Tulasnella sp. 408]|nr:hypothetical protein FRC00_002648 [Tulasnella sp. 408]